ncbi:MAG TPA: quinolinate synthase NadA, partial [Flavobacteriales bacterium]|nr:quinolinate synthase NadA [Flavobacteriales bacterium]
MPMILDDPALDGISEYGLREALLALRTERNAVFLAHYYQTPDIQELADFVGDSLALAQAADRTGADTILFCGVHFMAETAKILNPGRTVLLPDLDAGCSLADSAPADKFRAFLDAHPGHTVVSYINCSAAVKALSDIICT